MSVYDYWKNCSFDYTTFVSKVMSLIFDTVSRFVIVIFPRSKCLLILWLQSPSALILEPKKIRDIKGTKIRLVKAMVFPVVMYGCESWTIKKAEP